MDSNINLLFVSFKCKTCINLIRILENEKLKQYFRIICVDDKLKRLPPQIKKVPTMIVKTINKPLVALETFEWVKKMKFIRSNKNNNSSLGINGYSELEHSKSLDDKFAFMEDKPALPKSYFNYKSEKKHAIFTAPEQNKIKASKQDSLVSNLMDKRDKQDKMYSHIAKSQRTNAVINSQRNHVMNSYKKTNLGNKPNTKSRTMSQMKQYQLMQQMKQLQMKQNQLKNTFRK